MSRRSVWQAKAAAWVQQLRPYQAGEEVAAVFRARQLQPLLRHTPSAVLINLINVAIVLLVLWPQTGHAPLVAWAAVVLAVSGLGFLGWWRGQRRQQRHTASRRALRRAAQQAGLLAAAWAALPLAHYGTADAQGQFFIGMVITGMVCAGGFAMSTAPLAATVWVLVLSAGFGTALALQGGSGAAGVAAILLCYSTVVVYSVIVHARSFGVRLEAEARADRQNEVIGLLLRDFEDHASDLLWQVDAAGRFVQPSARLAMALGTAQARLDGAAALPLLLRLLPRQGEARRQWLQWRRLLRRRSAFRDRVLSLQMHQGQRWWSISARPLLDVQGQQQGWRGVATDITERHTSHTRLHWMAHNDALTGLLNRASFRDALQQQLAVAGGAAPLAVLVFDLDGFKQVNDSAGHAVGDALLQEFAQRLRSVVRRADVAARLGGDEFAVLMHGVGTAAEVQALDGRLRHALAQPCQLGAQVLQLRASMGVAMSPGDGTDVDALMNHADIAMYAAKHGGGERSCFFHSGLAEAGRRRGLLQHALRGALERQEFQLAFQPQVDAQDWRVSGFEALLRWRHADLGEVSPAEFIDIAEDAGLMPAIGQWVLHEACRVAAGWPQALRVAVNVSAAQLADRCFAEQVRQALAAAAITAQRLELEITESTLIADVEAAVATLGALRAQGCRVALDDFGTGYSALGYLRRFPFDTLKIDRSFVRDLSSDHEARVLVDSILAMSRALMMATVAEGVESVAEARLLQSRGCGSIQGFLVGRPMAGDQVPGFLASWPQRARTQGLQALALPA
jgi:diguanylate cyclase (GGDEF)-like protein/PAS domain S-box-containing protein